MKREVEKLAFDIAVGYHVALEPRGNYRRRFGLRSESEYAENGIRAFDVPVIDGVIEKIAQKYFYVNIGNRRPLVKVDKATFESVEPDCNASYKVWKDEAAMRARFEASEKRRLMIERLSCGYSAYDMLDTDDAELDDETVCRMWEAMNGQKYHEQ